MQQHDASLIRRHEGQFEKLDARVSALEGKVAQREALIERLDADFYNHGRDGMKTVLANFITEIRTRQDVETEQRDSEHRSNSNKLNLIVAIGTAGLFIIGALTLYVTYQTSKHGHNDPLQLFHSQSIDPVLSYFHNQQSTSIPTLR